MAKKKKSKLTKALGIVLVAVAVLTPAQLAVMGWYGGMGPMAGLKTTRLNKMAGNAAQYDFTALEPMENSPLQGKRICVLGSSVAQGSSSFGLAVGEYLAARFGAEMTKEAVGGTTLADKGGKSYIQRMLHNLDPAEEYALFVCQLSTNDAKKKIPLGSVSAGRTLEDFDTSTVTGAMEYIIAYAQETWGCPVVFFTGSHYDSEAYDAMVENLLALEEKWGICVADLWTDEAFNDITEEERALYMADDVHPTKAGYRDWWGPAIERAVLEYLETELE